MCEEKGKTRFQPFGFVSPIKQAPMCEEKGKTSFQLFGFVSPIKQASMCEEKGKTCFRPFGFEARSNRYLSEEKIKELAVEHKTKMNEKFSCLV